MNIKQSFSLAVKSLMGSKMRSFLTMLGIIIGVGAVIILMSVMEGYTRLMLDQFESMGTNLITVSLRGRGSNKTVTDDQMMALIDENSDTIAYISPTVSLMPTIKHGTESDTTTCTGVNEMYMDIKKLELDSGRFLEYVDVERRQKNCVVGTYIVKNYFDGQSPLGQQLKINGSNYTVVGVIEETADSKENSADDAIYIPYTLATTMSRNAFVSSYSVSATDKSTVDAAADAVEKLLYKTYSNSNFYTVIKMSAVMELLDEMTGTLSLVLAGIAGISLLVGGIGIMNIMLVSVTERTREIGIRKSLGARRRDIMSQFVVEAATTSSIGGILGILFGFLGSFGMGNALDLNATPTLTSVIIAFGVSVTIGIVFGYFPASKASKLNPIDALRYD